MKVKALLLTLLICITLLAGCKKTPETTIPETTTSETTPDTTDVVSTASIVNSADDFEKAISKDGRWIIALLSDLTIDKELTVDGDFKNEKNPPVSQRKLAFYAQDADRNITARYTLAAPKITINSPDCAIWYGTFKGDLYVSAKNFQLIGAIVDGNIFFTSTDAQSTFKMDADSTVTGKQELATT